MKKNEKIFLSPPDMSGKELKYIKKVFKSNYIAPLGEFVDLFEESIKKFTKTKYALALNSGTSAIHLALRVLGVKQGDIVLTSTFTFIGSVAPILYLGATPHFIDSDESWNLSPELLTDVLESWKGKLPKALIVTHLYGQMAKIDKIVNICKKFNIPIIEDSAESLGASFKGRQSGTFGDFGIFSFNGNKILTTSGGGMLIGKNGDLINKARFLSTQAKESKIHYEHIEFGYNYRISNILASIGVAQMEILTKRVKKRRKIFKWYEKELKDIVNFMPEIPNSKGNRWLTTIAGVKKRKIIKALKKQNIESRPLWKPMHLQPIFKDMPKTINGISEKLFKHGVCLPSGSAMNRDEVTKICKVVKNNV
jgi:UDP-N-acetylbacillosamine transaminase